jgi:hypothetical protein
MRLRSPLTTAVAVSALGIGVLGLTGPATADSSTSSTTASSGYDAEMLGVLAETLGTTTSEAAQRLDREATQGAALTALGTEGVDVDGAFYDGDRLVVHVDPSQAAAARAQGLTPRTTGPGQSGLEAAAADVPGVAGEDLAQVQSWGPDLATQSVVVTVHPSADADLLERLRAADLTVETGEAEGLAPTADVVPGQIMDLDPGTNCSLGYPGTTSDGNNVLLTAGHCVEGLPDILDGNGEHIGVGVDTRFASGSPSVDMGLMDIDAEDTGVGYVDTRNGSTVTVTGASAAPVGTAICKAGNTTGWTCGEIEAYGLTVNYGDPFGGSTPTSGLARATVCTEGGDSGGAYISGSTAQGMTSGGPVGADCGFNGGDVGSYSFYQPVVDAASYYGVTITTG